MQTIVAEQANMIGTGISLRDSEFIRAGVCYVAGSLKAKPYVYGRVRLLGY